MALNTDKFKKLARRWVGSVGSGGVADASVTTVPLSSATNLPTDTAVVAVIDRVDSNGTATATKEESVIGVVSSTNLVTCTRGAEGTAQAHDAGAVVEILVTNKGWNDILDGLLVQHNQLGLHTDITASDITASGIVTALTAVVTGQSTLSDVAACAITASTLVVASGISASDVTASNVVASNVTASEITSQVASTPIKFNDAHFSPVTSYTPEGGATATLDVSQAATHRITCPAGNFTIAVSNETVGQYFIIEILQDGVGSRTVTWFAGISWAGGAAPTLTVTASKKDTFGFRVTGADTYDGYIVGQDV